MPIRTFDKLKPADQEFMLRLYEQHKRMMYAIPKRFPLEESTIEDLVHDSIVKLIQKVESLKTLNDYKRCAYIVYTVKNTMKNYFRNCATADKYVEHDERYLLSMASSELMPDEILLVSERWNEFQEAWTDVDDEDKALLIGRYFLELSDADLAKQFKCKDNSIRMKLTRARRRARQIITQRGIYHEER